MVAEKKGLGGGSSALLFTLGGMLGAALAFLSGPREGCQPRSSLQKMAADGKKNSRQCPAPAQLEKGTNKTKRRKEPLITEAEYMGFGILLD